MKRKRGQRLMDNVKGVKGVWGVEQCGSTKQQEDQRGMNLENKSKIKTSTS